MQLIFAVDLHSRDKTLLESIQSSFLGVGNVSEIKEFTARYSVSSAKDLAVIVAHFDKYRY